MGKTLIERRRDRRCTASAMHVRQATLRPGRHVQVVDVSPIGALVQTDCPLRPGHRVHIRIVFDAVVVSVGAVIVRCGVWAIHPEDGVTYRGGLRFDERCVRLMEVTRSHGRSVDS